RFGEVDNLGPLTAGVDDVSIDATPPAAAPEPATMALLGLGLGALGPARRRRSSPPSSRHPPTAASGPPFSFDRFLPSPIAHKPSPSCATGHVPRVMCPEA